MRSFVEKNICSRNRPLLRNPLNTRNRRAYPPALLGGAKTDLQSLWSYRNLTGGPRQLCCTLNR
jgi:hypothetical protein